MNCQWVAFVFDGDDKPSFPESNQNFEKRAEDIDSKIEEVGDWWEFVCESPNDIHFFLLKCDGKLKADLGDKLLKVEDVKDIPAEETFLDCQLEEWTREFGGNGVIFLHWHNDWNTSLEKTKALQKLLAKQYPSLTCHCISSQMPQTKYGCVFDMDNPVVPVADFGCWYDMFKMYWEGGGKAESVNKKYTTDTFPSHTRLGVASNHFSRSGGDGEFPKQTCAVGTTEVSPPMRTASRRVPVQKDNSANTIRVFVFKYLMVLLSLAAGVMAGLQSLKPLAEVKNYLPVEAFNSLNLKGKVAILLLIFAFSAFAACFWGLLARALLKAPKAIDKE